MVHRTRAFMAEHDRIEHLAAQLRQPASADGWQRIWELFTEWPEGSDKDAALGDAMLALASWDDQLRRVTSQSIPLYRDNVVAPIGRLVRTIDFYRRADGTGDLVRIAASPNAAGLRRLTLYRCDIGAQGITALARSLSLNELTHLKLVDSYLPRGTAIELLNPSGLPSLRSLELIECGLRNDDLAALTGSPLAARLTHLDLTNNLLDDDAARILAQIPALRTLDTLDLSKNGLSAAAREVLASGAHLAHTRIVV
jgi:hypothetical protein